MARPHEIILLSENRQANRSPRLTANRFGEDTARWNRPGPNSLCAKPGAMRPPRKIPFARNRATGRFHRCPSRLQYLQPQPAPKRKSSEPEKRISPSTAHPDSAVVFLFRHRTTPPIALHLHRSGGLPSTARFLPVAKSGSVHRSFGTQSYASIHALGFSSASLKHFPCPARERESARRSSRQPSRARA